MREYFAMGRRLLLSLSDVRTEAFFLYATTLLILFKQDDTNLKRVYNNVYDNVNTDTFYENFCDLCCKCW